MQLQRLVSHETLIRIKQIFTRYITNMIFTKQSNEQNLKIYKEVIYLYQYLQNIASSPYSTGTGIGVPSFWTQQIGIEYCCYYQ